MRLHFASLLGAILLIGVAPTYYGNSVGAGVPTFDARYYGVKCNGTTDDTIALQATLTAAAVSPGGRVTLPAGPCKITAPINVPDSGIDIGGAGALETLIEPVQSNGSAANFNIFVGGPVPGTLYNGLHIHDLGVLFLQNATAGSVFDFPVLNRAFIEHVRVFGCFNGYLLGQDTNTPTVGHVWLTDSLFENVAGALFVFVGGIGDLHIRGIDGFGTGANSQIVSIPATTNPKTIDVMFWYDGDYEGFNKGALFAYANGSGGGIADAWISDLLIDSVSGSPAMSFTNVSGDNSRIKLLNLWLATTAASQSALVIDSGNSFGARDFDISGGNYNENNYANADCIYIGKATEIRISRAAIYGCGGGAGVHLTAASGVVSIHDSRIGGVYPGFGALTGVLVDASFAGTYDIQGNDFTGSSTFFTDNSSGTTGRVFRNNRPPDNVPVIVLGGTSWPNSSAVPLASPYPYDCIFYITAPAGVTIGSVGIMSDGGSFLNLGSQAAGLTVPYDVPSESAIVLTFSGGTPTYSVQRRY